MLPNDDVPRRERARTATSALGSTTVLLAAIVLMSAAVSFGAVRTWFPQLRTTAPAAPPTVRTPIADARVTHASDVRREIEKPTTAGRLSIVTDPPGARVEIDGRPRGISPVTIDGLAAAEYRITVASDSGVAERTITVSNDVMTEVVFSLPRPSAPLAGWVAVGSPFPVQMLEHGEIVGASGATKIMMAAGTHEILLRNETLGFEATRTISVVAGHVASIDIDPPKSVVNVNARPWADVLIDGQTAGETPLSSIPLAIGAHEVVFRHPQFGERTERIVVTERGPNRVAVDFTK